MARRFSFSPRITVFSAISLSGFIFLGFWQLDREVEKERLIVEESEQYSAAASLLSELDSNPRAGIRVRLHGNFDPEVVLLLDNRVLDGKVGFEVHQLFNDKSGLSALVNRGFVQMGRTRSDPPLIPELPVGEVHLEGRVHFPSEPYLLPADNLPYETFPVIVQYPDVARLAGLLVDKTLVPFIVRSAENAPGALPRFWPATVMLPEKHRAYAVQWFAMAFAVALAWLAVSYPRIPKNDTNG